MKARKGFIATVLAVVIALFLLVTSIYAIRVGMMTVREETNMTLEAQRSLYPIAWSITNAVLQHLRDKNGGIVGNGETYKFTIKAGSETNPFNVTVSCDVYGDSSVIRVTTGVSARTLADVSARGLVSGDVIARGSVSAADGWAIVWR